MLHLIYSNIGIIATLLSIVASILAIRKNLPSGKKQGDRVVSTNSNSSNIIRYKATIIPVIIHLILLNVFGMMVVTYLVALSKVL